MKIFKKIPLSGVLMMLALLLAAGTKAYADSSLAIAGPVIFAGHDEVKVPVDFNKENPVVGMQFDVKLPDFLEYVGTGVEWNSDRFTSTHLKLFNNNRVAIGSMGNQHQIQGEDGPLLYLCVRVKSSVSAPVNGVIGLSDITISGAASGSVSGGVEGWTQPDFTAVASFSPYEVHFLPAGEAVVNSGSTGSMVIDYTADCPVLGFQATVTMPAGFTLAGTATLGANCPADAMMSVTDCGNGVYGLVYFSMTNSPLSADSGELFRIDATSSEGLSASASTVKFTDIQVTYASGKYIRVDNFEVVLRNNTPLYTALIARVEALENALTAAQARIAVEAPDVKDNFTAAAEAISGSIDALRAEIEEKMADNTIGAHETDINAEADGIQTDIDRLVADAKAAQEEFDAEAARKAANEAAYNQALADITALENALAAAKAKVAEDYPHADVEAEAAAIASKIEAAREAAAAALAAVADEGTFSYTVDSEGINGDIAEMLTEAAAQEQAYTDNEARKAANEAAYNQALADITALENALEAAKAKVAEDYPHADVEAEAAAIASKIEAAREAAAAALAAVAEEGTFSYTVDSEGINGDIAEMLTEAAAREHAYTDNEARKAANEAAYNQALADITALENALEAAKAKVAEDYPHADVEAEAAAIASKIEAAREAAAAALAAVAEEGTFSYTVDSEGINGDIAEMLTEAAAQEQAYLDEEARKAANKAAYEEALAQLDELQAALNKMIAEVGEEYPDVSILAEALAAQQAINDARNAARDEYEDVENEGVYSYTVDTEAIQALIDAIREKAISGIGFIFADGVNVSDCRFFNLNGVEISRPVPGSVCIVVMPDGVTKKVVVK